MPSEIITIMNKVVGYAEIGIHFVKDLLTKVAGFIPVIDAELAVAIVFMLASLWIASFIAKKFVTKPFSLPYLAFTIIIALSLFLNLMYL